eukprot:11544632-Ditylum_brightwellii.AAC.1
MQPPRVVGSPIQRVQTSPTISKPTIPTPSPRVQRNKGPNLIPFEDDNVGHHPPPKPHPISVPTPKGGSFYTPPEEGDIS